MSPLTKMLFDLEYKGWKKGVKEGEAKGEAKRRRKTELGKQSKTCYNLMNQKKKLCNIQELVKKN